MSHWTIGKRLVFGFVAVITVSLVLGAVAYTRLAQIDREVGEIATDNLPGVELVGRMSSLSKDIRSAVQNHLMTDDAAAKASLESEIAANATAYDTTLKAYEKTITAADERKLLEEARRPLADYRRVRQAVLALSRDGRTREAQAKYAGEQKPVMTRYFAALDAIVQFNSTSADVSARDTAAFIASAQRGILIGLVIAVLVSLAVAGLIITTTNKALGGALEQLSSGAEQVASASGQVATSAQSLSQGATEQAASLQETSASMEEMASMTRKNAENTQSAASLMGEVGARVHESNGVLGDMVTSMNAIQESSRKISKIIKTIDEIAFQTNILALNAAVEAARAGEAGMGFAVVADEVRNLAQRSAQAARDTAALIEESIDSAASGTEKVGQVSGTVTRITESVDRVMGLVDEINVASAQQAQGIDQVSQAIAQMEKVTQTTAATAEESAAASEELSAQSETVRAVVVELGTLVGRQGAQAAASPRATRHGRPAAAAPAAPAAGATMPAGAYRKAAPQKSAEELLPLGNTGTFGRF